MAPIKFDEHIKEQLEQRQLTPSKDAWRQLEQRLDAAEEGNKKSNHFWWIGIAAGFIGILLVVSVLFKDEKGINTNTVVGTEHLQPKMPDYQLEVQSKNVTSTPIEIKSAQAKEEVLKNHTKVAVTKNKKSKSDKLPEVTKAIQIVPNPIEETLAEVNSNTEDQLSKEAIDLTSSKDLETIKAEEVVAKILQLKDTQTTVSDADIEALLDAAHKEITLQRTHKGGAKTVDADALLQDVEFDIAEESFRSKVFEMLKAGYKEIQTAVVERNN